MTGFTESGAECSNFQQPGVNANTGTGVDECPIGFSTVWEPLNPGSPNTMIKITVRLAYNGSSQNKYQNSMETSYRQVASPTWPLYTT